MIAIPTLGCDSGFTHLVPRSKCSVIQKCSNKAVTLFLKREPAVTLSEASIPVTLFSIKC